MFVTPKPDRQVPDPERGGYLSPDGREVEKTPYWLRRVNDEDVDVVDQDAPSDEPANKGKGAGK